MYTITDIAPTDAEFIALIAALDAWQETLYPAESNHLLDLSQLPPQTVIALAIRSPQGEAVGCGAIVLSEEGFGDQVDDLKGHVWIVDPIDGTMNFVMQKRNFAIMMGLYVDGQPTLGYIMDVVEGTLYHGGKGMGVFANQQRLHTPENKSLADSLMVMNGYLTMNNVHGLQKAARKARGLRMYGSAGIEMIYVLTGCLGAYGCLHRTAG